MLKLVSLCLLLCCSVTAHTLESAGAPPSDLSPAISALMQKDGMKVMDGKKVVCEIWLRATAPAGAKSAEENVTLPNIPHGALLGAIRFTATGADRRGQQIKPGVYTMRYSNFPQNGDHQGVAPQRDFLVISKASDDQDAAAAPAFTDLVALSQKAMGTPHPGVFSFWKEEAAAKPGISQEGEHDWVLRGKLGDIPVAIIVVGKAEG